LVCHRVIGGKLEGSESSDFAAKGCGLLDGKRYGRAEDATDIQSVCKNNGVQVLSTFGEGEQCFCCPNLPFQTGIGCVGVQQHGAEPEQCRSGISIRGSIGIIKVIVMIGKADVGSDSRELAIDCIATGKEGGKALDGSTVQSGFHDHGVELLLIGTSVSNKEAVLLRSAEILVQA